MKEKIYVINAPSKVLTGIITWRALAKDIEAPIGLSWLWRSHTI